MVARWRAIAIVALLVVVFGLIWAATAFQWAVSWWVVVGGAVVLIGLILALAGRPRRAKGDAELYASDPYSDAYLGRARPVAPHHDPAPTSLIDDRPGGDSLELPPRDPGP